MNGLSGRVTEGDATMLDRADLMFCLSRAYLPPPRGWSIGDWAQPLADDLAELGDALGMSTDGARSALRAECERWSAAKQRVDDDADPWLVEYARLFLIPPIKVPLNAGLYLEGSLAGVSGQMMRCCYQSAGIEPSEEFRDLPDHVAMQLEFVARLLERAAHGDRDAAGMADEFIEEFILAWVEPLELACLAAAASLPAAHVYVALTRLVREAVAGQARRPL